MTRSDGLVDYGVDREVADIVLDSPHNRNALSAALVAELGRRLAEAAADPAVRAVRLGHTGSTFCAGADLAEARAGGMEQGTRSLLALLRQILELPKPVIAGVDGHVRAGGLGLLGACDIVLAGPRSTFAFTEVRIGVAPAIISLTTLPRLSARAAARYYLTGETFDAAEAARIGLVTQAVDDLDGATSTVMDALRKCSPQGLAETKPLTSGPLLRSIDADGPGIAALSARLFGSEEAREGMTAFAERRPPRWAAG